MADVVPQRHKRHTARGIVVRGGQILLMERWRPRMHYFSIPGGGIEAGETPETTIVREILEETTVSVAVERQVLEMRDGRYRHRIYLCRYVSGEPRLPADAPESLHMTAANRFQPAWVDIDHLPKLPFTYWQPLQQPLITGLRAGFPPEITIVSARPAS
ncbi:MAG TPA: NUDIX domain-containing protein [Candidatus Saccharimonadales bacterium]|nr:NUDIX domain-containing protein [Candidatus Saccharimonadales bacterium]